MGDSIAAYEDHAQSFLDSRDISSVGVEVVRQWALSVGADSTVIEIACGGGLPITKTLVDTRLKIWAIDSSETLVDVFKNRFPEIPVQCESVLTSDYFMRKYDAAISVGLIFLLEESDQTKMLERVSDVLHPGASFLLSAPVEAGRWKDINTGHTCVSLGRNAYEDAFERTGFRLIQCHEDVGKNNYYEIERNVRST